MRNVLCKYGRIAWSYMDVENMKYALRYLAFTFLSTNFLHFNFWQLGGYFRIYILLITCIPITSMCSDGVDIFFYITQLLSASNVQSTTSWIGLRCKSIEHVDCRSGI